MSSTQADAPKSAPAPFSYAQAARGASKPASTQSSQSPSGAMTPAKDQSGLSSLKSELNGARWADSLDDEDVKGASTSSASTAVDASSISSLKSSATSQVNGVASPGSAEFGGSSTATLVRDENIPNVADMPESAWESKSRDTNAAKGDGRNRGSRDRETSRGRKKASKKGDRKEKGDGVPAREKETWIQPPPVKLVDAPAPTVNPWLARAQVPKAPAVPKPAPVVAQEPVSKPAEAPKAAAHSSAPATASSTVQKSETTDVVPSQVVPEEKTIEIKSAPQPPKPAEKKAEAVQNTVDAVAWPTPDTAQVDEKKKPQEKSESEVPATHEAKGKQAWNKLDFTPNVVFNTPLPGTARRGGKGGRGGKNEGGQRPSVSGASERRSDDREGNRRERGDAARSSSPNRGKRNSNDEGAARRSSRQESTTRDTSVKASEDFKSKPTEIPEQSNAKIANSSNTVRSKPIREEKPLMNGEKNETIASKEIATSAVNKVPAAEPTPAISTTNDTRKEVSPSNNERKSNAPPEFSSRHHERKGSGSYSSTFAGRGRGDRGRGGRGGRNNGHTFHPNAASFVNGHAPYGLSGYNGAKSPTGFGSDPFAGQAPPNGSRYNGRNSYPMRATSIPGENPYRGMPNGFNGQPPQLNTNLNGMYPQDFYPATALPYQNDPNSQLLHAVTQQMEYYFSMDNMLKDMFLRQHMDSQGFVHLQFIAGFARLKRMTENIELIKYVCQQSPNIEHRIGSDGVDRLRVAKKWEQWVLPMEDRDKTAQNDGPDILLQPPRARWQAPEQPHLLRHSSLPMPQSAGPVMGGPTFQSLNSFASPYPYTPSTNPADAGSYTQYQPSGSAQPMTQASPAGAGPGSAPLQFFSNTVEENEPDDFTDAEVQNLEIVVRDLPGRTLSNGSAAPVNGVQSPPPEQAAMTSSVEKPTSPVQSDRVNRFLAGNSSRLTSPRDASRNGSSPASGSNGLYYIKDKDSPSVSSPDDTQTELYLSARERALQQRHNEPCPYSMVVMYRFWEHFLVERFNSRMYAEFRYFAIQDASQRNELEGLNRLLKYYGKALAYKETPMRRSVAQDYVTLVRSEPRELDRPAFKQLRSAWRDGSLNMKNRKRVKDFLDQGLEEELDR